MMSYWKKRMAGIALLAILCFLGGCQKIEYEGSGGGKIEYQGSSAGGTEVSVSGSYAMVTKEDILKECELVLLGEVQKKSENYEQGSDGSQENYLLSEYTINPQEIYWGAVEGETLTVKFTEWVGNLADRPMDRNSLQEGAQVLLFLDEAEPAQDPQMSTIRIFQRHWSGHWVNRQGNRINLLTLPQEIAAAKGLPLPTEKVVLEGAMEPPARTVEEVLAQSETIYRGIVEKKHTSQMTDPQGNAVNDFGFSPVNREVTRYTIAVQQEYKSMPFGSTEVLIANGVGLSSDLILKGEDAQYRLSRPLQRMELEIGAEYIFCADWIEEPNASHRGEYVDEWSCFKKQPDGRYVNANGDVLDPQTIK